MVNDNDGTQAEQFFAGWEETVDTWDKVSKTINDINDLTAKEGTIDWVWRGVGNAKHPIHSSLYRRILSEIGRAPREDDVVKIEEKILNRSREQWRFDDLSALQTFAQIQHHGGPTRLLDVTFNPFVALWFAVQPKYSETDIDKRYDLDGRLFAFIVPDDHIQLNKVWGSRALPWNKQGSYKWKADTSYFWRPPSYNERIPAQNSAFIISGVPRARQQEYERHGFLYRQAGETLSATSKKYEKKFGRRSFEESIASRDFDLDGARDDRFLSSYQVSPGSSSYWPIGAVRQSTSIAMQMASLPRSLQMGIALGTGGAGRSATKTFTIRIKGSCKADIRAKLERRFGYNDSSIYPDIFGLANNVMNGLF